MISKEAQVRSIAKMISWRVVVTLALLVNIYLTTGNLQAGLMIASWAMFFNSILYWIHERLWTSINKGYK